MKSAVPRHHARKHRLYPINNEYHSSISNRGEGGGSKRWDVASFEFFFWRMDLREKDQRQRDQLQSYGKIPVRMRCDGDLTPRS